jgi:hypothetical protein
VETAIADTAATDLNNHDIVDAGVVAEGKEGRGGKKLRLDRSTKEVRHGPVDKEMRGI